MHKGQKKVLFLAKIQDYSPYICYSPSVNSFAVFGCCREVIYLLTTK